MGSDFLIVRMLKKVLVTVSKIVYFPTYVIMLGLQAVSLYI